MVQLNVSHMCSLSFSALFLFSNIWKFIRQKILVTVLAKSVILLFLVIIIFRNTYFNEDAWQNKRKQKIITIYVYDVHVVC